MTPRKNILRHLDSAGPDEYTKPANIRGFGAQPPKYREAVNELLKDRLISGGKDAEGNLVVAINPENRARIRRELRPWFAAPPVWVAIVLAGTAAALALLG